MGDLAPYLQALGTHRFDLVLTGVLGVLGVLDVGAGLRLPRQYFWFAAAVAFLFANYQVWHDEHERRIALENPNPKIGGFIEQGHMHWVHPGALSNTALLLGLWIENNGGPSTLRNWKIWYVDVGGHTTEGYFYATPSNPWQFVTQPVQNGLEGVSTYSADESIVLKTEQDPIQQYHVVEGAILAGFQTARTLSDLSRVRVSAQDRLGHTINFSPQTNPPSPEATNG